MILSYIFLEIRLFLQHLLIVGGAGIILFIIYFLQLRKIRRKYSRSNLSNSLKEKDLLRQLIDAMPDRIYIKDRDSRFILANKFLAKIAGKKDPAELIGKTDFDLFEQDLAQNYYDDEQLIMKRGNPMLAKEEEGLDGKGNKVYVSTTKIPIRDDKNRIVGIVGIGRDISPQKETESQLKRMSEILKESNVLLEERQEEIQQMAEEINAQSESLREVNKELEYLSLVASKTENVVVIMDEEGNFQWVNNGFEKKYGMNLEAFIKKFGPNIRSNSSYDEIEEALNVIHNSKKSYSYTARFKENEEVFWNRTTITPIVNAQGDISTLILIDSDITELQTAQEEIKLQNVKIEKQKIELEKNNATKDRFFSIIAHDLKNPFHSIMGFTQLLQKKYDTIERDTLKEYLEVMEESSNSAYHLLENLLEWARTQTNSVQYKPAMRSIAPLIDEIGKLLSLQASNKNIKFEIDIDPELEAFIDGYMIQTTVRNIAGNSIKFSNEGGKIIIKAGSNKKEAWIKISDNGIGMSEEQINKLFQLENISSQKGTSGEEGTGLGLIVCQEFMKINHGSISVSSKPGKGSEFTLHLPITDPTQS